MEWPNSKVHHTSQPHLAPFRIDKGADKALFFRMIYGGCFRYDTR
jgi:hypothetical protein